MTPQETLKRIEELVPSIDGWCTPERAVEYAMLVMSLRLETTVCIGVWGGRDVLALALAHQTVGVGRCMAVDPWSAEASVVGQEGANRDYWSSQPMHDLVYERFMTNLRNEGLVAQVDVRRSRASEVDPPEDIDLLIVDGNHGPDALEDVRRWAPHVRPGGLVFCDDIGWTGGAVQQAVDLLLLTGFRQLYARDTGAFFQRMRFERRAA